MFAWYFQKPLIHTVEGDILLDKLDHYGIRGCDLSCFKSYLSCRTQYVTYNGSEFNRQMIKCGVPQGSILGPLLFLIYTNNLCTVCKNTIPVLFADDTKLFSSGLDDTGTLSLNIKSKLHVFVSKK